MEPEPKTPDEIAAEGWTPDRIHPPFDLEEAEGPEPGKDIDLPKILGGRKEKQFRKAERAATLASERREAAGLNRVRIDR